MDKFFEVIDGIYRNVARAYKKIHRFVINTFFPRRIPPRQDNTARLPPTRLTPARPTRKKFEILNQGSQQRPLRFTQTRRTNKFTNMTETRPQKCPFCMTSQESKPGNITKVNGQWYCKTCQHRW